MCYPCKKNTGRMRSTVYSIFQYGNIQYETMWELAHPISFANPMFDLVDPPDNSDFFLMDPEEVMIDLTNEPNWPIGDAPGPLGDAAALNAMPLPQFTNMMQEQLQGMQTFVETTAEVMDITATPSVSGTAIPNQTAPSEESVSSTNNSAVSASWMAPEPMAMFPLQSAMGPNVQGQAWSLINPSVFASIVSADEVPNLIPSPGSSNQGDPLPSTSTDSVPHLIPSQDSGTQSLGNALASLTAATVPSTVPSASSQGNELPTPSASNQPVISAGLTVISHVASPVNEVAADIQQLISSHITGTSYQVSSLAETSTTPPLLQSNEVTSPSSPAPNVGATAGPSGAGDSYVNIVDSFMPNAMAQSSTASLLHNLDGGESPVYNVIHIGVSSQVTNSLTPTQLTDFMQQLGTHIGGLSNGNMPYVTGLSGDALSTFTANYNAAQQKSRAPAKEADTPPFTHFPPSSDPQPLLPPIQQLFPLSVSSAPHISHPDLERILLPPPEDPQNEEKMEEGEEEKMEEDEGEEYGGIRPPPGFF